VKVIRAAVQLACRSPSLHNSQPWRWVAVEGDIPTVELHLDPERVLHATDHSGRQALMSCGAALDHFRVAIAAAGWTAHVERFPNPNDRHHLASMTFTPLAPVTEGHHLRADAILKRRTDRLPFGEPADWHFVEQQLRRAVCDEAVRFDVLDDRLRGELAEASRLSESLRLYDTSYYAELSWWTGKFESQEGIPHSALVSAAESERVVINRTFPGASSGERRIGFGPDRAKIVVLSTYDNTGDSVLRCGEMLSAVLLEATMSRLATCPLTHITELQASRDVVGSLIGEPVVPQVLVRVGEAPELEAPPPATPRRDVSEVFEVRHSRPHSGGNDVR